MLVDHCGGVDPLVLDEVADEAARIDPDVGGQVGEYLGVGDRAVLCEVRVHQPAVVRISRRRSKGLHRLLGDLGRHRARWLGVVGGPYGKGQAGLG